MSSRNIDLEIASEWKELGFYYFLDETQKIWSLQGDRHGLLRFANSLRLYAKNPVNHVIGEHEHFGPYYYLKITTSNSSSISSDGWAGTPEDYLKIAHLIESHVTCDIQKSFVIGHEFAPTSNYSICFQIENDGFDPSSADPGI